MTSPRARDVNRKEVKEIPESVILGKCSGQWALHIFESEVHAVAWCEREQQKGNDPQLWLAQMTSLQRMTYVPPISGRLQVKK